MGHVLVPCPEEHAAELHAGLLRLSLGMAGWTDESIPVLFDILDPAERELVLEVAMVSVDHGRLPYRQAAKIFGGDLGQVLTTVTNINDRCRRAGVPALLITDTLSTTTPEGEPEAEPVLVIVRPVAQRLVGNVGPDVLDDLGG